MSELCVVVESVITLSYCNRKLNWSMAIDNSIYMEYQLIITVYIVFYC